MSEVRPLFEQPADAEGAPRRILLLSYHFPPGQAAGARRWEKLAQHAADRGWGLDVVTLSQGTLERADPKRLEALPAGTRVYGVDDEPIAVRRLERRLQRARKTPVQRPPDVGNGSRRQLAATPAAPRPSSFRRDEIRFEPFAPRSWLRAYETLSEYGQGRSWARSAEALARQVYAPARHRLIVSCGPPHMVHDAGRRLSRRLGVPLVMDLRDPWSFAERAMEGTASPLWFWLASFFEGRAVAQASLIVMNTEPARAAMQRAHPGRASRVLAVTNGFDEDDLPKQPPGDRFIAAYAGSIYIDRSPKPLFQAARRLIDELAIAPADFGIEFMGSLGSIDGVSVQQMISDFGLKDFVTLHPPGSSREAAAFLGRGALLVNLPQDTVLAIPSKIFEYMRYPAWILALEPPDSATAQLLDGTGADVVAPQDVDGLCEVLRHRYHQFKADGRPAPVAQPEFSRREQGMKLFDAIESLT